MGEGLRAEAGGLRQGGTSGAQERAGREPRVARGGGEGGRGGPSRAGSGRGPRRRPRGSPALPDRPTARAEPKAGRGPRPH